MGKSYGGKEYGSIGHGHGHGHGLHGYGGHRSHGHSAHGKAYGAQAGHKKGHVGSYAFVQKRHGPYGAKVYGGARSKSYGYGDKKGYGQSYGHHGRSHRLKHAVPIKRRSYGHISR